MDQPTMSAAVRRRSAWVVQALSFCLALLFVTACESDRGATTGEGAPPVAEETGPSFDPSRSDPKAIEVADRLMTALGGAEAWTSTRYIYFAFAVSQGRQEIVRRTHLWDKATGRHRVEGVDKEGRAFVLVHDVGGPAILEARIEDEPVTDVQDLALLKRQATALWINDTYWLLMPYKLKDPGVVLAYEGEESEDGAIWDVVRLSFDGVGMTPGDRYWAYVNRETGLMDRWAFLLQSMDPDAEPTVVKWTNWRPYGRIMLSDRRVTVGAERHVSFPAVAVFEELPETAFRAEEPLALPGL